MHPGSFRKKYSRNIALYLRMQINLAQCFRRRRKIIVIINLLRLYSIRLTGTGGFGGGCFCLQEKNSTLQMININDNTFFMKNTYMMDALMIIINNTHGFLKIYFV